MRMPEQPASSLPLSRQGTPEARGAELEAFSRAVEGEAFWDAVRTISACCATQGSCSHCTGQCADRYDAMANGEGSSMTATASAATCAA